MSRKEHAPRLCFPGDTPEPPGDDTGQALTPVEHT